MVSQSSEPAARAHPSDTNQRIFSQVLRPWRSELREEKPLNRFDRTFWRRVWFLVLLYWRSAQRR
jgi:hypothetical protein